MSFVVECRETALILFEVPPMSTISIEAAQVKLVELIRNMAPGEEVIFAIVP